MLADRLRFILFILAGVAGAILLGLFYEFDDAGWKETFPYVLQRLNPNNVSRP